MAEPKLDASKSEQPLIGQRALPGLAGNNGAGNG
jgi:hypothetical protein